MNVERVRIPAGGFTFDAIAAGPPHGELVILLHGFPQGPSSWRWILERLAETGHRVVAPAQRGYSPGANPPDPREYGLDSLAADVVAIATALGSRRFHVAGHDWGGAVAWAVAASEPERVRTLTAVATPHPAAMGEALRETTWQKLHSIYAVPLTMPSPVPEVMLGWPDLLPLGLFCRASGLSGPQWRRDAAVLRRSGLTGPINWYRGTRAAPPSRRVTADITVPTLYVWGRRDPFLGRGAAERTAAHVRGPYRFEELDTHHWIPEANRKELLSLLSEHLGARARARRT